LPGGIHDTVGDVACGAVVVSIRGGTGAIIRATSQKRHIWVRIELKKIGLKRQKSESTGAAESGGYV
jgi:hypothetical protein